MEYSYRICEQAPETWVLWVHASDAIRFEQSYQEIADRLRIPGRNSESSNIFRLVREWLWNSRRKWLLILDNVDDASYLLEHRRMQASGSNNDLCLWRYVPSTSNGTIIVITRCRIEARKLYLEEDQIIEIPQMDPKEAVQLLRKKLPQEKDIQNLAFLAGELEYMPLAIV